MERSGQNCQHRVYHLSEVDEEKDIVRHIVFSKGHHNHGSLPPHWRTTQETREHIRDTLLSNPSAQASDIEISSPAFINNEKKNQAITKERRLLFGKEQGIWGLPQYEKAMQEHIRDDKHSSLFGHNIKRWLFPSITSINCFSNASGETEHIATIIPPLSVEILSQTKVIHVDVKHKKRHESENCHHFGISTRLETFHGKFIDKNTFVCDIFMSHLTRLSFNKAFYAVLECMHNNAVSVKKFLDSLEFVVADFSLSQRKGIEDAIFIFSHTHGIPFNATHIKSLFAGCFFHFRQSATRIKDRVSQEDKDILNMLIERLINVDSINELERKLDTIAFTVPSCRNWAHWWKQDSIKWMLLTCITEDTTNNPIESHHSHFKSKNTLVLNYRISMDRYIQLFDLLANTVNNTAAIRYTLDPKRQRYIAKKRKRLMRSKHPNTEDRSGNPPIDPEVYETDSSSDESDEEENNPRKVSKQKK
jgi:hypothetical protein